MLATYPSVRRNTAVRAFSAIRTATFAVSLLAVSLFVASVVTASPIAPSGTVLSGTYNIPGDYATLGDAISAVNGASVGSPGVTLNLLAGNPQTALVGGYAITTSGSAVAPIVIQGNGNTVTAPTPQTSGALNDAIFKLIGTDYVTIDGFTMLENPSNTTTTAASNNMTEWGVAVLYASTTDGAQNVTIQNNTISLNRTYQNTFGIYSNSTHSAAVITSSATATGATGGNSNLKIYANAISNVNVGMVVVGPTAAADHNDGVDIGGAAAGTGNTITNYGTTGSISSYANVSGTVNGILVRNTKNINVSYNSITSSSGASGVVAGTLRGIYIVAASSQPIGTFTNNINSNTLAVTSHVLTGAVVGIAVDSTTSSATSTTNITANNFTALNHTIAAATGAVTAILQSGSATSGPLVTSVSNNTFTNITSSSTGAFTFLSDTFTAPTNGTKNVNNNAIITGFNRTGASGAVTLFSDNGSDTAGTTNNFNNNNFSNLTLAGTSSVVGISSTNGGAPTKNVIGNTVNGISGATGAIIAIQTAFDAGPTVVSANTISNLTGGGNVTGLLLGSGVGTRTVSKNSIHDLSGTAAASVVLGVSVTSTTTSSNITLSNNLIGNLTASIATSSNGVIGLSISGTATASTFNVFNNTIYISNAASGTGFGSSGISTIASSTAASSALNLRNNIVVNTSVQNGAGLTVAYRRSAGSAGALANYAGTSNNNDFYAGTPGVSNLIYADGTSSAQTIAAYKAGVFTAGSIAPRDSFSISENPTFVSTVGSNPNFLHISTATATQLESGAAPIAGLADDFDGDTRNASTPDIGADEFNGILLDLTAPAIAYAPLLNTASTGARTLTATITDASGVPTAGVGLPVLYWRSNAGSYTPVTATSLGSDQYQFSFGAGVLTGDVVSYYVAAQDTAGTPNVGTSPSAGASGLSADPPAASTPPTSPNMYTIVAAVAGSLNVGTAEAFTSLTNNNAQGIFKYLNDNAVTGNIVINITSDLAIEDGAVALNEFAAPFTVMIKPTGGVRNVTGAAASTAMIRLNGASRVTIDGSTSGVTDRSLYLENTSTTAPVVVSFRSIGTTPITGNTIKNATIRNGASTSSAVTVTDTGGTAGYFNNITVQNNDIQKAFIGVFTNAAVLAGNGSGLLITQNNIDTSGVNANRLIGVYVQGADGATVSNNMIGNFSATDAENDTGIWLATGAGNTTVSGNTVTNLGMTLTTAFAPFGIRESSGLAVSGNHFDGNTVTNLSTTGSTAVRGMILSSSGVTLQRNTIQGIINNNTDTYGAFGIDVVGGNDAVIKNNFVSDVNHNMSGGFAFGPDFGVVGIRLGVGTGHKVYNNSVNLFGPHTGTPASTLVSAAFSISTTAQTGIDVRNNVFANNITGGTTSIAHVSVFLPSGGTSAMNLTWNNNAYYNGTNPAAQGLGQAGTTAGTGFFLNGDFNAGATTPAANFRSYTSTLSAAGTNDDSSIAFTAAVPFVSASDLHLQSLSAPESAGTPIVSVTNDIDGDPRPATKPDIGADELVSNLTITPTAVAFGNLPINTTSGEISVTLANTGAGSLDVTTLDAAATPFARTGTGTCAATLPITIAPGGSCTLTYTFAPTAVGPANQPLTVTSNGPGSGTITLTGTGAQGNLTITPTTVPFGNQAVGSTSAEMTVILANTGNASLDVTALSAAAAPFARTGTGTCGPVTITIPASGSCTLTYTFAPSGTGAANQVVTVTANAPGSGTITLSGNGTQGNLTISPATVPFGNQTVNTTSAAMTVTLANTGTASLQVTTLDVAAAPFALSGGTCGSTPITIAASGSCTLTYTFSPIATGPFNQTLTVTANAPGSGSIALSGTGTAVGAACTTGMPIEVSASAGLAGPTGYGTLNAGFASINNGIHQGNIAVAVCGDTTEVATALLNASGVGPSVYTSVLVTPSNGAARSVSGTLAAPLVDLSGADNVTFDGLNAGGNALTFSNASTAATAGTSTIRFIGGATNNMVMNTTLLGSSTTTLATVGGGTVYIADDAVTPDGNDNNTISNNDIGPAGTNLPNKAIFGFGTNTTLANANSGVVISNNNIYDFFNATSSVSGIYIANGNDQWTLSGNRIYQTAARAFNAGIFRYGAITLSQATTPRGSFIVMNNVIGFGAADGTGITTISGTGTEFRGIDAPNVDTAVPTMIQGNTISGINQTTNRTLTSSTSSAFIGMLLGSSNGLFDVGGVAGNTIGSLDGSSTIVVNGLATVATAQVLGIYDFSFLNGTIANNNIGSFTIQGAGTTLGFRGILVSGTAAATTTVTGNTIANITDTQVGNNILYGISVSGSTGIVTGNTIRNFTGNANGATVVMQGIGVSAGTAAAPSTVARNTVHSLNNTVAGGSSGAIYALDFTFPAQANVVERNLVHSIAVDTTFVGYQVNGIIVRGGTTAAAGANSTVDVRNNMIRLGLNAAGAAVTAPLAFTGIRDSAGTAVANNYYHNSVYIGGSGVTGGVPLNVGSTAFNSDVITTTRNFQDNIFWNARSNVAAGAALHIAIRVGGTTANPPGLTSNYNDLYATGNDGVVGVFNGSIQPTLANWQAATGQDATSFAADPQFIAPNGDAITGDLHISPTIATPIEGTGLAIASVTNDFDGEVRAGLTPTDVGADAGNFVAQIGNLTITPTALTFGQLAVGATSAEQTVTLANNGTGTLQVTALTPATAPFARTGTGTCSATLPIAIAVGGSCTLTYTFAPTSNGPFNQTLTVTANAPGSGTITLSGTGIQGNLTITPTDVTFGNQTVGTTSSPMPVTFTNIGNAPVTVTSLTAPTSPFGTTALAPQEAPAGFVNCTAAPFTLAAGASCSVGYTFSPTATGPFTQMLTAATDGLGGGTITLSGTGIQGALTITPATVDFGNQSVGITSAPSTVTLANTGDATLDVTTLTAATSPFARQGGTCGTAPFAITAGASCTLSYTFTPTASGPASQVLTVTSNAPGGGTITLMGNGVQGTLLVSPTTVDFGSPDLFTTTEFKSVTLTNTGAGSLQVNSLTFAAAPFARTTDGTCGNSLPITLAAGASCTLTYTFAPTTAGVQSQAFTVSNNGTGGSGSFTLTGTGVGDRIFQDGFDGPAPPEAEL